MVELWFVFSLIWTICASVDEAGRKRIDNFLREMDCNFPGKVPQFFFYFVFSQKIIDQCSVIYLFIYFWITAGVWLLYHSLCPPLPGSDLLLLLKTLLGHSLRVQCGHQEEDLDLCGGEAAKGLALLR